MIVSVFIGFGRYKKKKKKKNRNNNNSFIQSARTFFVNKTKIDNISFFQVEPRIWL